ncbi:hypothetical protein Tco_1037378, partial [Tanacetum coccineum]
DALEGGDISILNSLVGYDSPWSLQLWGVLGAKKTIEFSWLGRDYSLKGEESLLERDALLCQHTQNLLVTKHRMERQANWKRQDVEFNVGDMVLVKLQPYRQVTLAKHYCNKLAKRCYGPFKLLEHVGKMAYVLALPDSSKIHPKGIPVRPPEEATQPIDDESWFLSHEIDYPNVNEKIDHGKNKSTQENRMLKGRDVFDDKSSEVFSVTPWAAKCGRRVLCYVQGSGRRKRKKSVGCSSGRRDYSLFGASIFPHLSSGPVLFLIKEYGIPKSR